MSILKQQGQRMLDKKWAFHFAAVTIKNWEYIIDGNDVFFHPPVSVNASNNDPDRPGADLACNS
jgi:hypothetical protein